MEAFVRSLPPPMTERQVRKFFEPFLTKLGIYTFRVEAASQASARLTFADTGACDLFLETHGEDLSL